MRRVPKKGKTPRAGGSGRQNPLIPKEHDAREKIQQIQCTDGSCAKAARRRRGLAALMPSPPTGN